MDPEGDAMVDLPSQIETLYRVMSQSWPAPGSSYQRDITVRRQQEATGHNGLASQDRGRSYRWFCSFYCLWFSLPLSIWFSSGWIGLLFYWRTLSTVACLVEKFTGRRNRSADCLDLSNIEVLTPAIESENSGPILLGERALQNPVLARLVP
jgi:hypothetical protein